MLHLMIVDQKDKVLYRYSDGLRQFDKEPFLEKFKILRETEKSYFIEDWCSNERRVPKIGKNVYAWDTEQKALFNYYKRKQAQLRILTAKKDTAYYYMRWASDELKKREQIEKDSPTSTLINKMKEER